MPTLSEYGLCLCCDEHIYWNGSFWQHGDGTKHTHPARPVNEVELLRAEVIEWKKRYDVLLAENESLRQMLFTETGQDRLQEMPY